MKKGYVLFELILVITLLSSVGIYIFYFEVGAKEQQKTAAYEFQELTFYARAVARNSIQSSVKVEVEEGSDGSYCYKVKKDGVILCRRNISYKVGIFTSKSGSGEFNAAKKLDFSIGIKSGLEESDNLTLYFGDRRGNRINFRLTIIPTSGRVFVYEGS